MLDEIEKDPAIALVRDVPAGLAVMDELRPRVRLQGRDVVDLYLLAAIIGDRRDDQDGPAVFFSANKRDFRPGHKVPETIYRAERIVWREDFDLPSALGAWRAKYGPGALPPAH